MKRGQVYYADFKPAVGSEQDGVRPCVIIQNNAGNRTSPTVIVAIATTQSKTNLPTHVPVSEEDNCLGLKTTILLEQLRTIDKKRIKNYIGKLSDNTMKRIDEALCISLALHKKGREMKKTLNELIHIGNVDISVKEYKGQRVVTFKDIDMVHKRPDGTARATFNRNKDHFSLGEDYFVCETHEAKEIFGISAPNGIALMTEQGYLMLVKPFSDDLAWEVQRQLVKTYFQATKRLSPEDMLRIQLGMIDEDRKQIKDHESRIENLENNTTLDYGQQRVLEDTVNKTVIGALDGKESNAYKEIGKKVFAECNHDLKSYFKVNARANVPKKRFEEAVEYAENWKPCTNTMMRIADCNAQMNI